MKIKLLVYNPLDKYFDFNLLPMCCFLRDYETYILLTGWLFWEMHITIWGGK